MNPTVFREYNSLIQVMNYLNAMPTQQIFMPKGSHIIQTGSLGYRNPVLNILSLALFLDFSRYQTQISSKTILEEVPLCQINTSTSLSRSKPLPGLPKPQNSTSQNAAKSSQKNRPPKNTTTVKPSTPKTVTSPAPNTPTVSTKPKNVQKQPSPLTSLPNTKKKIHKIPEARKENPGRIPHVSLIQTAEIGRNRLSEKEKKRIRERLLVRRIRQCQQRTDIKQNRRQLRTQH